MEIKTAFLDRIMDPALSMQDNIQVSLFIVGKKANRFKQIDLTTLTPEKFNQLKNDKRFVAIIETTDTVYAHANQKFVDLLQNQKELTVNGKKVAIAALSDDDYNRLDEVFEEYIRLNPADHIGEEKEEERSQPRRETAQRKLREFYNGHRPVADKMQMNLLLARMENTPTEIALLCLQKMNQAAREQARRNREDDLQQTEKAADILKDEIKQSELKREIRNKEIFKQTERT